MTINHPITERSLMVVLDGTVVTIALPSAQRDLGISDADRQWTITAYTLAFGGLLLLGGRIADYQGRKRSFLVGLLGFAADWYRPICAYVRPPDASRVCMRMIFANARACSPVFTC